MSSESPSQGAGAFRCPHCGAYAQQEWQDVGWSYRTGSNKIGALSKCANCDDYTVWTHEKMVYPKASTAPRPHPDMPESVERDFKEARLVVADSPRSAAALLRLAIQRLVEDELNAEGGSLYNQIGNLVEEGEISPRIQRALDSVRVIGNNSVHPGEMNMDDALV